MKEYDHKKIEKKWQKKWEKDGLHKAKDFSKKPKYYCLIEFPYPSGEGLHVGHIRSNTAMDILARKKRSEGYNVLYPIGWDAFGLPTENYAIKTGIHPKIVTKKNTDNFRRQLKSLGFSFDWSREINTTDPKYYKWTQWMFLQFYKNGLAYKKKMSINWCASCKIGLANEEVVAGECERCGGHIEKRDKEQWMLAITKYADRLIEDLDKVDYLEEIKTQQKNWIGKSEGATVKFKLSVAGEFFRSSDLREKDSRPDTKKSSSDFEHVEVFTTRLDTIFGCTYLVVAPEHKIIRELESGIQNLAEVQKYIEEAKNKTDLQRTEMAKEKTGVELKGVKVVNPFNNEEVPVFVADYVLGSYGTGAVMAVPAHDERDWEFAKKYNLPIKQVICPNYPKPICPILEKAYLGDGHLVDSGHYNGLKSQEAREAVTKWLEEKKLGGKKISYKLRDWVFSRQRYWGEPIPLIHCEKCGTVPVPEKDLPVKLPDVKNYQPTDTGESPLANVSKWVNVKCPECGGKAKRETDTMPNWAGSSWYFLRYLDPKNNKAFADKKKMNYWMPVDWYNGGMEHVTLHLLYSRFWNKFLYEIKAVPISEPYKKRTAHGLILAESGEKMSKSKGNVINPDNIVKQFGADTLRVYEMFMGPFDQSIKWNSDNMIGSRRFLERVWRLQSKVATSLKSVKSNKEIEILTHKTIKKVGDDIESFQFNTAISSLMILLNEMEKGDMAKNDFLVFLKLLSPFAPHIAEELWASLGRKKSIHLEKWPPYDASKLESDEITIIVQINGKVRGNFNIGKNKSQKEIENFALSLPEVKKWTDGKQIKKILFIKGRVVSVVI